MPNIPKKVTELYAFICVEDSGDEGIMAFTAPSGVTLPMIGADMARVNALRPIADKMSKHYNRFYEIKYFVLKEQ